MLLDQKKKVALITVGCPKNEVDSEVMADMLFRGGMEVVGKPEEAEIIMINTCGFIEEAKKESIDTIFETLALRNNGQQKKVFVWGCFSERYKKEINKMIPEVDGYFGVEPFNEVSKHLLGSLCKFQGDFYPRNFLSTPSHTAYLKIAEGCDHQCTFCAIPLFKGNYRSRSMDSLVKEAEFLANRGVKELILIAQDTTRYGFDRNDGSQIVTLLEKLSAIKGIKWIRLMYTHPAYMTNQLIDTIGQGEKICKYIDMPIQHISDKILRRMGRNTKRDLIERLVDRLRNRIPGLVLRTAFILGFPGEGEKEFTELIEFVQAVSFERLGTFIFSPEEGTRAFHMKPRIPKNELEHRYHTLNQIQKEISLKNNRQMESQNLSVIVDGYDQNQNLFYGRSQGDCLEVDQTVWIRGEARVGEILEVVIDGSGPYDLMGYLV